MNLDVDSGLNDELMFGNVQGIRTPADIITEEQIFGITAHPTAPFLAVGLISGDVQIHQLRRTETRLVSTLQTKHQRAVNAIEFSEDGNFLYTASTDRTMKVIDCETQQIVHRILRTSANPHKSGISAMNVADANLLCSGDDDGVVCLWDLRSPRQPKQVYDEHADFVSQILYFSEMHTMVSASGDTTIGCFDIRKDSTLAISATRKDELMSMAFIPATNDIVCGTPKGVLPIWKYGSWKRPFDIYDRHAPEVECILSFNDNIFFTGAVDGLVRVVQHHPVRRVLTHLGSDDMRRRMALTHMSITSDRAMLCVSGHERAVQFIDIEFLGTEKGLDQLRGRYEARHMDTIRRAVAEDRALANGDEDDEDDDEEIEEEIEVTDDDDDDTDDAVGGSSTPSHDNDDDDDDDDDDSLDSMDEDLCTDDEFDEEDSEEVEEEDEEDAQVNDKMHVGTEKNTAADSFTDDDDDDTDGDNFSSDDSDDEVEPLPQSTIEKIKAAMRRRQEETLLASKTKIGQGKMMTATTPATPSAEKNSKKTVKEKGGKKEGFLSTDESVEHEIEVIDPLDFGYDEGGSSSDDEDSEGSMGEEVEDSSSDSDGYETIWLNPEAEEEAKKRKNTKTKIAAANKKQNKDSVNQPNKKKMNATAPVKGAGLSAATKTVVSTSSATALKSNLKKRSRDDDSSEKQTPAKAKQVLTGTKQVVFEDQQRGSASSTTEEAKTKTKKKKIIVVKKKKELKKDSSQPTAAAALNSYTTVNVEDRKVNPLDEPEKKLTRAEKRERVAASKWLKGAKKEKINFRTVKAKSRRNSFFDSLL